MNIRFEHEYKFEENLRRLCSDNAQESLKEQLGNVLGQETLNGLLNPETTDQKPDIAAVCADLFVKIIFELASDNIS